MFKRNTMHNSILLLRESYLFCVERNTDLPAHQVGLVWRCQNKLSVCPSVWQPRAGDMQRPHAIWSAGVVLGLFEKRVLCTVSVGWSAPPHHVTSGAGSLFSSQKAPAWKWTLFARCIHFLWTILRAVAVEITGYNEWYWAASGHSCQCI